MAKQKTTYDYPRASVTVDIVVATRGPRPEVLLVRRNNAPFAGCWALPGGFIEMDETLEASARRELHEETGIAVGALTQLGTFGDPGRDPRGRSITIAYLARVPRKAEAKAGDDAGAVAWFPLHRLPALAFDHKDILALARKRLKPRVQSRPDTKG